MIPHRIAPLFGCTLALASLAGTGFANEQQAAHEILAATGIQGGIIVHVNGVYVLEG
ncbi:MAG: hypothetical protein ACC628_11030 [Pirellulaceae bacterium]